MVQSFYFYKRWFTGKVIGPEILIGKSKETNAKKFALGKMTVELFAEKLGLFGILSLNFHEILNINIFFVKMILFHLDHVCQFLHEILNRYV